MDICDVGFHYEYDTSRLFPPAFSYNRDRLTATAIREPA